MTAGAAVGLVNSLDLSKVSLYRVRRRTYANTGGSNSERTNTINGVELHLGYVLMIERLDYEDERSGDCIASWSPSK
jgi:hypothetical protein